MEIEPNGIAQWAFENTIVDRRMTIDNPTVKLLVAVGHAEAHGDVKVKLSAEERSKLGKVESDADSLKALRKAMESGDWHYGSHEAFLVQAENALAENAESDEPTLTDESKRILERGAEVSKEYLDARDAGEHHENAVRLALGQDPFSGDDKELDKLMKDAAKRVMSSAEDANG